MKTILLDGFIVGSTSYCDVAAGLNELVGIYGSNRTCTVKQDSWHVFFLKNFFLCLFIVFFFFSGIMLLLAVFTLRSWCMLFVVLLCELGTMTSSSRWFVGRAVRARHTAVPDPPH